MVRIARDQLAFARTSFQMRQHAMSGPPAPVAMLNLPPEILHHLVPYLTLRSLAALALTCRPFAMFVSEHGFKYHALHVFAYSPFTSAPHHRGWSWSARCRWAQHISDRAQRWACGAEVLGGERRQWPRACMPLLHLWAESRDRAPRIVVAKGPAIEMWELDSAGTSWEVADGSRTMDRAAKLGLDDVTGIVSVVGAEEDLVLSHVSGIVKRVRLVRGQLIEVARYPSPVAGPSIVQALESRGNLLFAASTTRPRPHALPDRPIPVHLVSTPTRQHSISIQSLSSPWTSPTAFSLASKPWSLLPAPSATPTWLAVGHSGSSPLSIHFLGSNGEPLAHPLSISTPTKTSIYALASPSSLNPHFRPDTTVLAAAYDSTTRVYDLRTRTPATPIMQLSDPFSDDALYSLATGGPSGSYVAVGTARSGVRIFDVRNPASGGITAFPPMRERSPIYGVAMEFARIWAVGERRAFVLDFEGERHSLEEVKYYGHDRDDVGLKSSRERRS